MWTKFLKVCFSSFSSFALFLTNFYQDVQQIVTKKLGSNVFLTELKAVEALESLSRSTQYARECSDRIVVRFKVARLFGLPFEGIQSKDPYDVLQFLLIEGPDQYSLCKQFIHTNKLNTEKVCATSLSSLSSLKLTSLKGCPSDWWEVF